jgi:hypothetical protein
MNTPTDAIAGLLQQLISSLPLLIVWIAGLLVALGRWRQQPRIAVLVIASCALSLLTTLFMPTVIRVGYRLLPYQMLPALLGFAWTCLAAISTGLLLCAAFIGRGEKAKPTVPNQHIQPTPR